MKNKRKAAVFFCLGTGGKKARENLEVLGERRKRDKPVLSKKKKRSLV
jgi:hypothetical protein